MPARTTRRSTRPGRVRLPGHLIEHAGLAGACMIVGVDDHLEVWNPAAWSEHDAEIDAQADEMAESLGGGATSRADGTRARMATLTLT